MNKKKLAVVLVLAVAAIVIIGVLAFHNSAKAPVAANPATGSTTTAVAPTSTGVVAQVSSTGSSKVSVVLSTSSARQSYANSSFSISYPAGWNINTFVPFTITNFGNVFTASDTIPAGGALVIIGTSTVEQGYLPNMMSEQLAAAVDITTSTLTVDGVACPTATFEAAYAPGATSKNVSVYCVRGTELWEVNFSYEANDPAAAALVADFNSMLGSMKFLP